MTALVSVMNKHAVALAADSAGTVQPDVTSNHTKIFPMNKLFALSKRCPVGVMVCGDSQFLGIPWETIFKNFRADHKDTKCDYLSAWRDNLIQYLTSILTSGTILKTAGEGELRQRYLVLVATVARECAQQNSEEFTKCFESIWNKRVDEHVESEPLLFPIDDQEIGDLIKRHEEGLKAVESSLLDNFKLPNLDLGPLRHRALKEFATRRYSSASQIVIAGFGDKEWFPGTIQVNVDGAFGSHLRWWKGRESGIDWATPAEIMPFAQADIMLAFLGGVHPGLRHAIETYVNKALTKKMPELLENILKIDIGNEARRKSLIDEIAHFGEEVASSLKKHWDDASLAEHIRPFMNSVAYLSKAELATLAESLIMLTSIKRRMDIEGSESVGGPVDVAVISKSEGFIWIKRKHYFEIDKNPNFRDRQKDM